MKLVAFTFAAIGSLLFTQSSFAQVQKKAEGAKFVLACSDDVPTLGFVVRELTEDPNTIVTELFLFQGTQHVPVGSNIRASDLDALKKRAELLSKLPTYLRIEWPRANCTDKGPFLISCQGPTAKTNYEGAAVTGLKMTTVLGVEATTEGQTFNVGINLSLNVSGEEVLVPIHFPGTSCTSDYTF